MKKGIGIRAEGGLGAQHLELHVLKAVVVQMLAEEPDDPVGILSRSQTEVHLGAGLTGEHRLGALSGVAGDDAADVGRGSKVEVFLDLQARLVADEMVDAEEAHEMGLVEVVLFQHFEIPRRQLRDAVVEALDEDAVGLGILDGVEGLHQPPGRVFHDGGVHGMGVSLGGADMELHVHQALVAQVDLGGAVGLLPAALPVVAVAAEEVAVGRRKLGKMGRADLLLALDEELDAAGQAPLGLEEGVDGADLGGDARFCCRRRRGPQMQPSWTAPE